MAGGILLEEIYPLGHWALGIGHWALGFGCWGLGVGCWVLGFGPWALGFGLWGLGVGVLGLGALGLGLWALGVGLGVGCWALGLGPWALGFGGWALGFGPWALGFGCWCWCWALGFGIVLVGLPEFRTAENVETTEGYEVNQALRPINQLGILPVQSPNPKSQISFSYEFFKFFSYLLLFSEQYAHTSHSLDYVWAKARRKRSLEVDQKTGLIGNSRKVVRLVGRKASGLCLLQKN